MNTLTLENVDSGIGASRNLIIDRFILASSVFGFLYMGVTLWRDLYVMGVFSTNSLVNLITACIPTVLWFYRKKMDFGLKSLVLFISYLITTIKSILIFGTASNISLMFLCFCCVILALSVKFSKTLILTFVLSLIIPVRAYLHFSGIYPVDTKLVEKIIWSPTAWFQNYITFILVSAIVTFGTAQLRVELNKYLGLLQKIIGELVSTNRRLQSEIDLKNVYHENLLVSSKKFESLFEGSRDGVVLLNNSGKVQEANAAICEITGYSVEELKVAGTIFDVLKSPYGRKMEERFKQQIEGGWKPELWETSLQKKSGELVPVEINSNVIFTEDDVMIMGTIRDISFRKQMEHEKFNSVLEGEERERARFSKDIHDDLGPVFSTLNLYLQTLGKKETDSQKKEILDKLSGIVDGAVKQVREISHNLSPYLLRDAGLVQAINTHLSKIKDNKTLATEFICSTAPAKKIPQSVEIVLYRVFQELLNNTLKHSEAEKVKLILTSTVQQVTFTYIDNGKGFEIQHVLGKRSGIGLMNIENRIKSIGGIIDFAYINGEMVTNVIIQYDKHYTS